MALVQYRESSLPLIQLRDEINRLFNSVGDADTSGATASWIPAVDISEYQDRFELSVDLPGVSPEAVEIELANGVLTLSGERRSEKAVDNKEHSATRIERATGRFYVSVRPSHLDTTTSSEFASA
jgi:HSP20 family protein